MSKVFQVSEFQIRGSIANITMKNLSENEKEFCDSLVTKLFEHDRLKNHKNTFCRRLSSTIKCEYLDREYAEQDYKISLWKGVVMLFFHRKYEFYCTKCDAREYKNKSGNVSKIDRLFDKCPACLHYESSIAYHVGERYYENPETILFDENQLVKFFGEWTTNAVRQHLKENNPTTTRIKKIETVKYYDMVRNNIIDLLKSNKIGAEVNNNEIRFNVLSYPPTFSADFIKMKILSKSNGVDIHLNNWGIKVIEKSVTFVKCENVTHGVVCTEDSDLSTLYRQTVTKTDRILEDVLFRDHLTTLLDPLNNSIAMILAETGNEYEEYTKNYGHKVSWSNIRKMFNLSSKQIRDSKEEIAKHLV